MEKLSSDKSSRIIFSELAKKYSGANDWAPIAGRIFSYACASLQKRSLILTNVTNLSLPLGYIFVITDFSKAAEKIFICHKNLEF